MNVQRQPADRVLITGVETLVVNAEMRNWILVKVLTDQDGLHGWGEASLNWKTAAVLGAVRDLEPLLVGTDARDIESAMQRMVKHSYYRMGIVGVTAMSGIEHALWDIYGKSVGLPVWRLLGGRTRDKVRVYTHLGLGEMSAVYEAFDPGKVRDQAQGVVERGYGALKVVIIPYTGYTAGLAEVRRVESLMGTLREAVGDDVDIMVDFHGRPASTAASVSYIRAIEPFDPMFCEEPVAPGDTDAMVAVARQVRSPLAAGERLVGLAEFLPLLASRSIQVAQPDLNHTGGLLEGKKIAALAEAQLVGIAPHNPNGPVAGAAALHFDVSTPNFVIQEEMSGAVPWYHDVVSATPITRSGGYWEIPTAPGLGIEIDESEAAKHPYAPEVVHSRSAVLADGTIANW
ncbi:enolase C-terminal domain-like protein [Actinophytocola sp.]|uniref:enolase C-terminal domain-like protein n=1 Tax=Actinophytocola sp. TaxID=1872138 RepID=UPI003D6B1737